MRKTCSHCHTEVEVLRGQAVYCPSCQHRADVSRLACDCYRCRSGQPTQAAADPPPAPIPWTLWLNITLSRRTGWRAELHRSCQCDDRPPVVSWAGLDSPETARAVAERWAAHHLIGLDGQEPKAEESFGEWWFREGQDRLPCDARLLAQIAWCAGYKAGAAGEPPF